MCECDRRRGKESLKLVLIRATDKLSSLSLRVDLDRPETTASSQEGNPSIGERGKKKRGGGSADNMKLFCYHVYYLYCPPALLLLFFLSCALVVPTRLGKKKDVTCCP
jgi:hypothetical protein